MSIQGDGESQLRDLISGVSYDQGVGNDGKGPFVGVPETISTRFSRPVPTSGWGARFRNKADATVRELDREALELKYHPLVSYRPELAKLVGCKGTQAEPIHRWFFYKESFAPELVRLLLLHLQATGGVFVDPFAGVGTSLLVAAAAGFESVGIEFLPVAHFVAQTKVRAHHASSERLVRLAEAVMKSGHNASAEYPDLEIAQRAFDPAVLRRLLDLNGAIAELPATIERDLLRLSLLSSVEELSHATKDGTSLRFQRPGHRRGRTGIEKTAEEVDQRFLLTANRFAHDLAYSEPIATSCRVVLGDARQLSEILPASSVDCSITSPPYPNRYDYAATYQLELGLGFINSRSELQELRRELLRSNVECTWPETRTVEVPALDEVLDALLVKGMSTTRVFRMLAGYFEDMNLVIRGMATALKPGASWAVVIGNVQFSGEPVPVDLILAELAEKAGLTTEAIWVARHKSRNAQQIAKYGDAKVRESVLILRKR